MIYATLEYKLENIFAPRHMFGIVLLVTTNIISIETNILMEIGRSFSNLEIPNDKSESYRYRMQHFLLDPVQITYLIKNISLL